MGQIGYPGVPVFDLYGKMVPLVRINFLTLSYMDLSGPQLQVPGLIFGPFSAKNLLESFLAPFHITG